MGSVEFAHEIGGQIAAVGGAFMLDDATTERGAALGLDLAEFYGLGRGGVLGDAPPEVVASAFQFFPPEVVTLVWSLARAKMAPADAVAHYTEACRAWGRAHLPGVPGLDALCAAAEKVVVAAPTAGAPLFAGWGAVELPGDVEGRAAQLLHVLREHRGANHFAAVLAVGLTPLEAVIVSGGADEAALFGWPRPYPDPEPARARHAKAEALTDRIVAPACAVLDDTEREAFRVALRAATTAAGLDA